MKALSGRPDRTIRLMDGNWSGRGWIDYARYRIRGDSQGRDLGSIHDHREAGKIGNRGLSGGKRGAHAHRSAGSWALWSSSLYEGCGYRLQGEVDFQEQVEFDTLTWGRRQIGYSRDSPPFVVELFELFDDPFVLEQFARRRPLHSRQLGVTTWVPSAEDIIVQKLRWGRPKDLEDARDVLTVQGPENLDMDYIARWCQTHGNSPRLAIAMDGL